MPQKYGYDALRQRRMAGEFTRGFARPEEPPEAADVTPEQRYASDADDFSLLGATGDFVAAPFRGVEGAIQSTYGLLDAITFDSLPDYDERLLGKSKYITGKLLEGITQFGVGFVALGGAVGAVGKGVQGAKFLLKAGEGAKGLSTAGNIARGVVTDFTVFDGQSGRLADLVAIVPGLEEPMNEYLSFALTDEDDNELVGRMKNALEGAGVGAAIDGVLKGVKWLKAVKKEQAAGKAVEEAVAAADKVVHIDDVKLEFKQLDDLKFGAESPIKVELLDEAVLKANSGEVVWLNPDGSESLSALRERLAVKAGVEGVEVVKGGRSQGTVRLKAEADIKANIEHTRTVAADVLGRELDYDEAAVDTYVDLLRKAANESNPESAAAKTQIEGVKARLSARGRRKLEAVPPSGRTTEAAIGAMRKDDFFVKLADFGASGTVLSRLELTHWMNKFGSMLDNPQTTIKLENGRAEIGVSLSPEQAKDNAMKKALEAFRCLGGV